MQLRKHGHIRDSSKKEIFSSNLLRRGRVLTVYPTKKMETGLDAYYILKVQQSPKGSENKSDTKYWYKVIKNAQNQKWRVAAVR